MSLQIIFFNDAAATESFPVILRMRNTCAAPVALSAIHLSRKPIRTGAAYRRELLYRVAAGDRRAVVHPPARQGLAHPFFYTPHVDYPIACLPTCCSAANPAKYP